MIVNQCSLASFKIQNFKFKFFKAVYMPKNITSKTSIFLTGERFSAEILSYFKEEHDLLYIVIILFGQFED